MNRCVFKSFVWGWPILLVLCMLGFWKSVDAQNAPATGAGKPPFANAVDQRDEMIRELREIRGLLKTQNALLEKLVEHADGKSKSKR